MTRGIEPNMPDLMGAQTTRAQNSVGKFNTVFDALSYGASIVGPAAAAGTALKSPRGAEIVGAAVNATAGYGSMPGAYSGVPLSSSVYGGVGVGGLTRGGPGGAGDGDIIANAKDMLAQSQASSVSLLMIQDEQGRQTREFGILAQLIAARDGTARQMISKIGSAA